MFGTVLCLFSIVSMASEVLVITPEALLDYQQSGEKILLLDVRSEKEFANGYIESAQNIPYKELPAQLLTLAEFKSRPVVVYCERGGRASKAEKILLEAGFSNVQHLEGDFSAWRASERPQVKP